MSKISGAIWLTLMISFSSSAFANYWTGYTDWNSATEVEKHGFVLGELDFMVGVVGADETWRMALADGLKECLAKQRIRGSEIVHDVDRLYGDYPSMRRNTPAIVTYLAALQNCKEWVDNEMQKSGLPKMQTDLILKNLLKAP